MHVRQCEREIQVRVLRHGVVGTEPIGECCIKVKHDLIDVGFPKRQSYAMMNQGKVSCKVVVSYHNQQIASHFSKFGRKAQLRVSAQAQKMQNE